MEQTQRPKLLASLPPVDIVVTMGYHVQCPFLPCKHQEDWGLDDPSGKCDAEYTQTIAAIKKKILELKQRIENGLL